MKKVVSSTAFVNLAGVAGDEKSEGMAKLKRLGKNWKLRYFKLARNYEQLYGSSSMTKKWKYIVWNT